MTSIKLNCSVLAKVPESVINRFWAFIFRELTKHPQYNSMSLIFGYSEIRLFFGTDGIFDLAKNDFVEIRFKERLLDWFAGQVRSFKDEELRYEISGLQSDVQIWYEDWIPLSFKRRSVKSLRKKLLGQKPLGLWRSPFDARFGANKLFWLEGDKELERIRKRRIGQLKKKSL